MASGHAPKIGFGHWIPNATASLPSRDTSQLSHGWSAQVLAGTWVFAAVHDGPPGCGQRRYQRAASASAGAKVILWSPPSGPGQCTGYSTRLERMLLVCRGPNLAADGYVKTRYRISGGVSPWVSADFISQTGPVATWSLITGELSHSGGQGYCSEIGIEIYGGAAAGARIFDFAFVGIAWWSSAESQATLEAPRVSGSGCRLLDTGKFGSGYAWGRPSTPPPAMRQPLALELSWGGVTDTTKQALERAYAGSVEAGYQPGWWDGMFTWLGQSGPGGAGLPLIVVPDLESFPLAGLFQFDGPPSVSLAGSEMSDPPIWNVGARLVEVL